MKKILFIASLVALTLLAASSARSQTQEVEGYTIIRGGTGAIVCLGRWVPPKEVGRPGVCEGQMVDVAQLTAISSRLTADKLDQVLLFLAAIDQKLADNIGQLERLIEAVVSTQAALDRQAEQGDALLRDAISARFESLSRRITASDAFKKDLEKMREEIIEEVKKHYPGQAGK